MKKLKIALILSVSLFITGCMRITDYDDCVPAGLEFEFDGEDKVFILDDSRGKHKYSSMNFKKGEFYLCVNQYNNCIFPSNSLYYQGWNLIPVEDLKFTLTGKYKINEPKHPFAPTTDALQVEIDGRKAWISTYILRQDRLNPKYHDNLKKLSFDNKSGFFDDFICNSSAKKIRSKIIF